MVERKPGKPRKAPRLIRPTVRPGRIGVPGIPTPNRPSSPRPSSK